MSVDLTTLQAAASWASVTLPTSSDPGNVIGNLSGCITAASIEFLRLTGRGPIDFSIPFNSPFTQPVTYTELYDGNGNEEIYLRNIPVTAISSLTVNGASVPAASGGGLGYQIGRTGRSVLLGRPIGRFENVYGYGRCFGARSGFPLGSSNVAITYTAGFALVPITNELATIPASTPFTATVATLNAGRGWLSDLGVRFFVGGAALTPVTVAPSTGQYYVQSPGVYLFAAADAGKQVQLSYDAAGTPADITVAINQMVALNYKRRNWIGQKSVAMKDVGSTTYTLEVDPEILRVVKYYKRRGTN